MSHCEACKNSGGPENGCPGCPACDEKDARIAALEAALARVTEFSDSNIERLTQLHGEALGDVEAREERIAALVSDISTLRRERKGEVWLWQGDGEDHPESLSCPVLMHPEDVRSFVAAKAHLARVVEAVKSGLELLAIADHNYAWEVLNDAYEKHLAAVRGKTP